MADGGVPAAPDDALARYSSEYVRQAQVGHSGARFSLSSGVQQRVGESNSKEPEDPRKKLIHPILKSPAPTGKLYLALDIFQFAIIIVAFVLPGLLADTNLPMGFMISIGILIFDQVLHLVLRLRKLRNVWPIRLNAAFVAIFSSLLAGSYTNPEATYRWFQVIQNGASALFCLFTIAIGNPMIADFGKDEILEVMWDHWAFHTICTHLTWAWTFVFSFMAGCSAIVMVVPGQWSNILFNYVLQILVTLVAIKLSYSYPNYYKRKHQQEILRSFSPDVLASFDQHATTMSGADDRDA